MQNSAEKQKKIFQQKYSKNNSKFLIQNDHLRLKIPQTYKIHKNPYSQELAISIMSAEIT